MNAIVIFSIISVLKISHAMINLSDTECGVRGINNINLRRQGRIVGGEDASPAQFPWLVSVTRRGGHFCGGTLLNRHWIVTAAHCLCSGSNTILSAETIRITVGQHDLTKYATRNGNDAYEISVEAVHIHPDYKCSRVANDIAMLRLRGNGIAAWSHAVQPACLSDEKDHESYRAFAGTDATVAGWGWLGEDNGGKRADVLQKVDVRVIENDICAQWYRAEGKKTRITEKQMCAGHEAGGKDACWADSGGPLMTSTESKTMVIGIVSTGIGCARPRLPGLYTRVSDYLPWIQQIINQ